MFSISCTIFEHTGNVIYPITNVSRSLCAGTKGNTVSWTILDSYGEPTRRLTTGDVTATVDVAGWSITEVPQARQPAISR